MEIKKYPNAVLENYSKILVQLGLVLALFVVYELMQMKSYPKPVKGLSGTVVAVDDTEQIVEVNPIEVKVQPAAKAVITDRIERVEDEVDVIETVIESTETDENEAIIVEDVVNDIVTIEEEEEIVEDVPFVVIEEVPVFPGCTGNKRQLRECFSSKMQKFVAKEFNIVLASELGLENGSIQRIFVMFKIDKYGNIVNIQARAPHKKLKQEAIRVISELPKMTPGKQRGKPVGVKYSLPITFKVQ